VFLESVAWLRRPVGGGAASGIALTFNPRPQRPPPAASWSNGCDAACGGRFSPNPRKALQPCQWRGASCAIGLRLERAVSETWLAVPWPARWRSQRWWRSRGQVAGLPPQGRLGAVVACAGSAHPAEAVPVLQALTGEQSQRLVARDGATRPRSPSLFDDPSCVRPCLLRPAARPWRWRLRADPPGFYCPTQRTSSAPNSATRIHRRDGPEGGRLAGADAAGPAVLNAVAWRRSDSYCC